MKHVNKSDYEELLSLLFEWFEKNKRPLPWRKDYAPYDVWISEMMLQQTQMERGVQYFLRWKSLFPNVFAVAEASESEILQAWEGLGYYSRAKNLHKAAQEICAKYGGEIPCDYDALLSLPGIGPYTVAAIMGIAFEEDFATIDANVERVFSRLCNIENSNLKQIVTREVNSIFPQGKARIFNQAVMEFGALLCKKNPQCSLCPIVKFCDSYAKSVQNARPVPKEKAEIIPVYATFCLLKHPKKGFIVRQRPAKGLWANMWEFVGVDKFILDLSLQNISIPLTNNAILQNKKSKNFPHDREIFARSVLAQEIKQVFNLKDTCHLLTELNNEKIAMKQTLVKHSYTNHRLQAYFFYKEIDFDISLPDGYKWVAGVTEIAMPAHHRKAVNLLV